MTTISARHLADEAATELLGRQLAAALKQPEAKQGAVIFLHGDLGTGKTTLSRALIRGLGYDGPVKSPTYTLIEPYDFFDFPLYHFDLYRLSDPEEVEFLGVEDYFRRPVICLIEWPEKGQGYLPLPDLELSLFDAPGQAGRSVEWQAHSDVGRYLIEALTTQTS